MRRVPLDLREENAGLRCHVDELTAELVRVSKLLSTTREQLSGYIADFCIMRDALKSAGFRITIGDDGRVEVCER